MPRVTPEEFQRKHAAPLKAAIEDMRKGFDRVREAPGAKAAASADKWHARISAAETKQKWARRVSAVSLEEWKDAIINKGLPRVAGGIDSAADDVVKFAEQLLSYQERLQAEIERMPDLTLEDSINRMTAWVRGMARFKREK